MTNSMWKSFKNKTVLVTGSSSGIGLALAEDLAKRGADLILVARSEDKLNQVAATIQGIGRKAHIFTSDLSVPNATEKLYQAINEKGLTVDLLINNAGYGRWAKFTKIERSDYAKMIQLNITALTDLCHLFIPDMVKKGGGGIINVASIAGFGPVPYSAVYSATKSYVVDFTEALRYEYQNEGLQIMTLCPGATESNFAADAASKAIDPSKSTQQMAASGNYISAEVVAKECLDAFLKNKLYVITGSSNKMAHAIGRHLPRKTFLNLSGNAMKKIVGE